MWLELVKLQKFWGYLLRNSGQIQIGNKLGLSCVKLWSSLDERNWTILYLGNDNNNGDNENNYVDNDEADENPQNCSELLEMARTVLKLR